jgi:hypothetical protein
MATFQAQRSTSTLRAESQTLLVRALDSSSAGELTEDKDAFD